MTQAPLPGTVPEWTMADRLRKARDHAGVKQVDFADQVGISRRSLTNYELGHSTPSKPVLLAWAMRTGVSMEWLITGKTGDGPNGGGKRPRQDSNLRPADYAGITSAIRPDSSSAERRRAARFSRPGRRRFLPAAA
jgi:transcriptional regulator with XRE-family HTH domain